MESDSNEFSSLIIEGSTITGNVTYNRWVNGISTSSPTSLDPGWDLVGSPMTNGILNVSDLATNGTNFAIQPYDNTDNTWNSTTTAGTYTTNTAVGYSIAKTSAGTVGFTGIPSRKTTVNISLTENNNKLLVKELFLNREYKIKSVDKIEINLIDRDDLKNSISIEKKNKNYLLKGEKFNATKVINDLLEAKNKSTNENIFKNDFKIDIKIDKTFLDKNNVIDNLNGYLVYNDNKIKEAILESTFSIDKKLVFTIKSTPNEKITTLFTDDAKPFVNRYEFIKGFEEGNLDFYSIKKNDISKSTLIIDNFKVQEVPVLAKLLTLASLQGIADLLTGEGIRFTDFEMKFSNDNRFMKIEELYAIGPAISIMMDGYIENAQLISLRGTLVPATTINRTISSIPLIGKILVGKKTGEGVFGVSFKIKGPPKDLKTTVNPVKTLTPRFITRTLEKIKKN